MTVGARRLDLDPTSEWVEVAAVLAEAEQPGLVAGVDHQREAERLALSLRDVRYNWRNQPVITWDHARALLESRRAEARRVLAQRSAAEATAEAARGLVVGGPIVAVFRPGEDDWYSPNYTANPYSAPPAPDRSGIG
jgi:hypothetical protein